MLDGRLERVGVGADAGGSDFGSPSQLQAPLQAQRALGAHGGRAAEPWTSIVPIYEYLYPGTWA